ncbi:MAG: hypothetical protein A2139_04935 [Desulfobacca sp. RBG_16_60_12]|nr:MAG: hypothetical protein A2139_04935 [Desulfobacca sp. RBG_16_60_12]
MPLRLLILKCSARKRGPHEPIAALERYDGPLWRVLRAWLRNNPSLAPDLDVYALSAAFGLIPAGQLIQWYDQTMSPERASELRPRILAILGELMQRPYVAACFGLSRRYLRAIEGWDAVVQPGLEITVTDGALGVKLGQLGAWLDGRPWQASTSRRKPIRAPTKPRGRAKIAGVEVAMRREEVLDRARAALTAGVGGADRFRDWYILVDGQRVAPKWLVSQIIGLPTIRFSAGQARMFLRQLGLDIEVVPEL